MGERCCGEDNKRFEYKSNIHVIITAFVRSLPPLLEDQKQKFRKNECRLLRALVRMIPENIFLPIRNPLFAILLSKNQNHIQIPFSLSCYSGQLSTDCYPLLRADLKTC